ncbi:MAG TPA: SpoIIE family protein phosphatase [Acidobacteriaceae bacterium]
MPDSGRWFARILQLFLSLAMIAPIAGPLNAQSFNLQSGREPIISLDGLWRFQPGDNPAWANPGFDDSKWPLLQAGRSWTQQGYPDYGGCAWYRFSLLAPESGGPLALLLPRIYTGYQVYANGRLMGGSGSTTPSLAPHFAANPHLFRIPEDIARQPRIVIAIRVWDYPPIASWVGGGTLAAGAAAGDERLLAARREDELVESRQPMVNLYASGLLCAVVGITILGLFLLRREEREYLWFAVLLLANAADALLTVIGFSDAIPFLLFRLTDEILVALATVAALAFFSRILDAPRLRVWRVVSILAALSPLSVAFYYFQWSPIGIAYSLQLACLLPAFLWIPISLIAASVRRDPSARLLLVPATLLYGLQIVESVVRIAWELGWQRVWGSLQIDVLGYPFPLYGAHVIEDVFVLALLMFLVRRFSLARREEARLAGEMDAARSVQALLVPAAAPETPGFRVESVYRPASEVGGDFYQVLPAKDGTLLVVVGDVSGKGLQAAMTVSTLVGALRGCVLDRPAAILAYLNRILGGMATGFTTCLCARIAPDGEMSLANAGHPAPYRNGEELELPVGLPLGLMADTEYEETTLRLAREDTLTFLSDGVVEARDASGELFGFERTRRLSSQPAQAIAEAAQRFGQEDDITVLTLAFAPVAAAVSRAV